MNGLAMAIAVVVLVLCVVLPLIGKLAVVTAILIGLLAAALLARCCG